MSDVFDKVGDGFQGDIAVDELSFSNDVCGQAVTVPVTIKTTTKVYPPSSLDCDFECNCICQWQNDTTGQFSWTVNKGSTQTILTGPSFDHTTNSANGYYIYIKATEQKANDTARIISQYVNINRNGGCLKFFYHMYGPNIYQLNIYDEPSPVRKPIWQKQGNKGDKWLFGHVFVENPSQNNMRFIFEGVV